MSSVQCLKQTFMTEQGLEIMKGHWLNVIRVWTLGFLAGVATATDSSLISYSAV